MFFGQFCIPGCISCYLKLLSYLIIHHLKLAINNLHDTTQTYFCSAFQPNFKFRNMGILYAYWIEYRLPIPEIYSLLDWKIDTLACMYSTQKLNKGTFFLQGLPIYFIEENGKYHIFKMIIKLQLLVVTASRSVHVMKATSGLLGSWGSLYALCATWYANMFQNIK